MLEIEPDTSLYLAAHWDADMPVFEFETPETDLDKNEKDVNSRNL